MTAETKYEFQTEARQILEMMVHSVYSNRDIFLRELISNASDALDKLRLESLTKEALSEMAKDLFIRIEVDKEQRTLSVSDNGIGMNREEIMEFIGTIAKSGTKEYLQLLKQKKSANIPEELIGQFGVGFYSSFMVADQVVLVSKKAGEDRAWIWKSSGDGSYTLDETERQGNGTTVTLHLKEPDEEAGIKDYTNEWTIRSIVKKYSDFISYPVKMEIEKNAEDGETTKEETILNSRKAIWMRSENDVEEKEYNEFYKYITHDMEEPLHRIVFSMEGTTQFRGLLFIPAKAPFDLFQPEQHAGISLYIKRVFIMSECRDLVPDYLRFVRGVIDSEDLPLNISREILQDDPLVRTIRKGTTRKVLNELDKILKNDRTKYEKFWKEFGAVLKEGIIQDNSNMENILHLSLFHSTESGDGFTTLDEYLSRAKEDQEGIYYITGQSLDKLSNSPQLEVFRDKGYEVLLLPEPVEEVMMNYVSEYEGKQFLSVAMSNVKPGSKDSEEIRKEKEQESESLKGLLDFMKNNLSDDIREVRISERLTSSASCLVSDEKGITPQMEKLLKAMGQEVPDVKKILEINPDHPVIKKMNSLLEEKGKDELLEDFARLLLDQAILSEGGEINDISGFKKRFSRVMDMALDKKSSPE
jgi:molecular chaperone HtpG